jgi:HK97 gp10 family phage protein
MAEVKHFVVDLKKASPLLFKIAKKMDSWSDDFKKDVTKEMIVGVNAIRSRIIQSVQKTKRASWFYMRGGKKHFPSAPGHAPAMDTGEFVRSITMDTGPLKVEVGADMGAPYAEHLEEGTKFMKARPWLHPAVEAETPRLINNLIKRIDKEFHL